MSVPKKLRKKIIWKKGDQVLILIYGQIVRFVIDSINVSKEEITAHSLNDINADIKSEFVFTFRIDRILTCPLPKRKRETLEQAKKRIAKRLKELNKKVPYGLVSSEVIDEALSYQAKGFLNYDPW